MADRTWHTDGILPYYDTLAIKASLEYMLVPIPDYGTGKLAEKPYYQESDTATFYTTFLTTKHFMDGSWVIAPERREMVGRAKKPDIVLAKCYESLPSSPPRPYQRPRPNHPSPDLPFGRPTPFAPPTPGSESSRLPRPRFRIIPRLAVEYKSTTGDRLEIALNQLIDTLKEGMDAQDSRGDSFYYQMFYMVARGPKVAIFSYYSEVYHPILDRLQIPHFRGCVSVTEAHDHIDQSAYGQAILLPHEIPNDLQRLNLDDTGSNLSNPISIQLREDAQNYTTPCVFDMAELNHREAFDKILFYISRYAPRRLPITE